MFWSHDLLGKKTALGAVWIAAHGKKLNKGRIMQVNVTEACDKVMDPEVPQALRLQAILVGGIVIVHAKQQVYLLEDAQEALRRLRAMDRGDAEARSKLMLGEGRAAAREEAITLPLDGDMRMLNLGELFPDFPAPALSEGGLSGRHSAQLEDGLFAIPTLPDETSQGTAPGTGKQARRRGRRGDKDTAAAAEGTAGGSAVGLLQAVGGEEVEVTLEGLHRHDLELMDGPETFAVPDLDQLPGMGDFFRMGGGGDAGAAADGGALPGLQDDLLPVPDGMEYGMLPMGDAEERPASGKRTAGAERPGAPRELPASTEETEEGSGAAAAGQGVKGGRRRGAAGRRRVRPTVDDIDTLQIRGRDYREWMADRADLLVARPQLSAVLPAAAASGSKSALVEAAGASLPPALRDLLVRNATLPKSERAQKGRSKGRAAAEAGLPDGEGAEGAEDGRGQHPYALEEAPLPPDGGGFFGAFGVLDAGPYSMEPLPEAPRGYPARQGWEETDEEEAWGAGGGNAFRRRMQRERERQAASGRSGSEDGLDVETERLRAALNATQGTDPLFLQHLGATPASAEPPRPGSRLGSKRASGGLRRDSESGALSDRSSERRSGGRLSDLQELGGGGAGGEDLGAMLPAVGEDQPFLEEEESGEGSRKRRRTGSDTSGLSQFELAEASGPTQELGGDDGPLDGAAPLQKQTMAFVSVMRSRFEAAEAQREAAEGGGDGQSAVEPGSLSFFGLAARLSRMDAAKLFYQTLQARSHGFLTTHQEEPYGDILLTRGPYL